MTTTSKISITINSHSGPTWFSEDCGYVVRVPIASTVNVERLAWLNIHGFSSMKSFAEVLSWCLDHQCLLINYS